MCVEYTVKYTWIYTSKICCELRKYPVSPKILYLEIFQYIIINYYYNYFDILKYFTTHYYRILYVRPKKGVFWITVKTKLNLKEKKFWPINYCYNFPPKFYYEAINFQNSLVDFACLVFPLMLKVIWFWTKKDPRKTFVSVVHYQ